MDFHNDASSAPRPAQRGQKPRVEQKGKCWLDLSLQYGARSRNVGLSILFILEFEERGVRKIPTGIAGQGGAKGHPGSTSKIEISLSGDFEWWPAGNARCPSCGNFYWVSAAKFTSQTW
jgi:hypothetical protein